MSERGTPNPKPEDTTDEVGTVETEHQVDTDEGEDDAGDGDEIDFADDHEGEDDAGGDEGQAREADKVGRKGKTSDEIRRLRARAQEAEREAAEYRRRTAEFEAQRAGRQTADQEREDAARYELMSPDEKIDFRAKKAEERVGREIGQLRFEQADGRDAAAFERFCLKNPAITDSIQEWVETKLAEQRRLGSNPQRQALALVRLGELALSRGAAAKTRQTKKGAANVERERAKPASGKSTVPGGQRQQTSEREARRKRLENVTF